MIAAMLGDVAAVPFLFGWALDTLIMTALLVLAVLAIRKPVARIFGPEVAYMLWAIPAVRLLLPPLPALLPTMPAPTQPANLPIEVLPDAWLLMAALWLSGAGAVLLSQVVVHGRLHRTIAAGASQGRVGRVRIHVSDAVNGPVSFGLLTPVIIMPSETVLPLTASERRLAIAHELAHHRRGDLWANALAVLFAALHWFNPTIRTAWRAYRFDQEAACDALVLSQAARGDRGIYARTLAKAASGHPSAFASPLIGSDGLKSRLIRLTEPARSIARRRTGAALAVVTLVFAMAVTATPVVESGSAPVAVVVRVQAAPANPAVRNTLQTAIAAAPAPPQLPTAVSRATAPGPRSVAVTDHGASIARGHMGAHKLVAAPQDVPAIQHVSAEAIDHAAYALRQADAAVVVDCRAAPAVEAALADARDRGAGRRLRITRCGDGSPELQLDALRAARRSLEAMADTRYLAPEHRAAAVAGIDREIADLEREIADRQN